MCIQVENLRTPIICPILSSANSAAVGLTTYTVDIL